MKKSLRTKVIVLVSVAVFIPVIVVTTVIVLISKQSLWNSIKSEQEQVALALAESISSYIQHSKMLIESISNRDYRLLTKAQIKEMFSHLMNLNESIMEISLLDFSGNELFKLTRLSPMDEFSPPARVRFTSDVPLVNRADRPEFQNAVKNKLYISPINFSGSRIPYIFISSSGKKYIVLSKLNLTGIWEIISNAKVGSTGAGYAFVVDKKGVLVAHPDSLRVIAHTDFSNFKVVKDFLSCKKGTYRKYFDETGKKVISFYSTVPEVNWGVFTCLPYKEVIGPVRKMLTQTVLWSVVFSGVFLFLGLKFATALLNPLSQLRDAVNKVSAGKFDIELQVNTGDEIEDLATSFNSMAKALKELEQIRQDLISMIVHDMKSPLSGIISSLDYLIRGEKNISEQKEILSITRKSVETLHGLIQNLLDVSKMEEGKLKLNYEPVDLKQVVGEVARQFELAALLENKIFNLQVEDNLAKIWADKALLIRVLNNLLYNSLHHTTSNGKIWLNVMRATGNFVQFEVGDDGVGIPEEYKTKIFEKFTQVERKRAHLRTGTGLGLTFCKMAIELHSGKIWVESEVGSGVAGENKGSVFKFILPV
ncbi:MAG: sensor histidine kinase [Elusimicrobiota bacterium]|nr:sensor histidine kinase [Elusimicrobiota bacterium]